MVGMEVAEDVAPAWPQEDKRVCKQDTKGQMEEGHEEACSEAALRRITGEEDLSGVHNLVLTVDTNETQVDHLGTLMPLLSELRLERGSTLASFRDLGSSLSNLRVVWLSACGIRHLDGVGALSGLEELYLAFNDVEDLTSIALHERLEVLDLESNGVRDAEQAFQLGTCPCLWSLTLTANPVCCDKHYRRAIVEAVPQLASLDEEDVTDDDRRPPPTPSEEKEKEEEEREEEDHEHPLLSTDQAALPPRRNTPTPDPGEPLSPKSTRLPSPKPFLRGSTGAGNRNLRELEMLGTCSSQEEEGSQEEGIPAASGRDGAPEGGPQPATAAADLATELSALSGPRLRVAFCGGGGDTGPSGEAATENVEGLDMVTNRALDRTRGAENGESGGRLGDEQAPSDGEGAGSRRGTVSRSWKVDSCRGLTPPASENSTAFVDEEEMVARAIKNFRLLSSAAGASKKGPMASPRRHVGAPAVAFPTSGCACGCATCERCASRAAGGNSAGGAGWSGGGANNSPTPRKDGRMSDIALSRCPLEGSRDRVEKRDRGDGEQCSDPSETRDAWEGNDWILEVLRLQDMGPDARTSLSQTAAGAESDATSVLTHGSEMSIAGNPAFGLRRRRVPDQSFRANDSTFLSTPMEPEPRHQANARIGDEASLPRPVVERNSALPGPESAGGAEAGIAARTPGHRTPGIRQNIDAHEKVKTRPGGEGGEEGGLGAPSVAAEGGAAGGAGGGGGDAEDASACSAFAEAWPRYGSVRRRRHRAPAAVGASLSCRALVSPPSLPQGRLGCVRGRPATEDTRTARGAESFTEGGEGSSGSSPPAAAALQAVAGVGGSGWRRRRGKGAGTAKGESQRALESRSAADLQTVGAREGSGVGDGSGRGLLASGPCGGRGGDGSLDADRDSRRSLRDNGGLGGVQGERGRSRGRLEPSEVPEWSPTATAGSGACEGGSDCAGSCWDGGFRFVHRGGDGGDGGGGCGGAGCAGGREGSAGGCGGDGAPAIVGCSGRNAGGTSSGRNSGRDNADEPGGKNAVLQQQRQDGKTETTVPGVAGLTGLGQTSGGEEERGGGAVGEGTAECDERLVALLRKRPKNVPQIRTRAAFRHFFRGMDRERLRRLLREAYADRGAVECDAKVKKRLMLLESSLDASL